jgi:uncharacterized protein (TIGR03000 family)
MFRSALSGAMAAALLLVAVAVQAAPPPAVSHTPPAYYQPAPQTHYYPPPSYHPPAAEPPLQSYYRSHYYDGVYPHADHYSYYDYTSPYSYRRPTPGSSGYGTFNPEQQSPSAFPGNYIPETGGARGPETGIARITVHVPDDAAVTFDGAKTASTGSIRRFESPLLARGKEYVYDVEARWQENGRTVTQKKEIRVAGGASVEVDFPLPKGGAKEK